MSQIPETNIYEVIFSVALYLAGKVWMLRIIWKIMTVQKTRKRLMIWVLLFSPTLTTVVWLLGVRDYAFYVCLYPYLAYILDLAALQWVRAIWEPDSATKDLEYDSDITNVVYWLLAHPSAF